jgi:hypothetical protein
MPFQSGLCAVITLPEIVLVARRGFDSASLRYGSRCKGIEDRDRSGQAIWQTDH